MRADSEIKHAPSWLVRGPNTVVVLNAERYQENVVDRTLGEKRRVISRLYLGASRASDELRFVCSTAKGGIAEALKGPIDAECVILDK